MGVIGLADAVSLDTAARFFGVIGTNLLLSGDNAVVIALASRRLPPELRRRAIFWGASGAVVLRIFFAAIVTVLLTIPYLQVVGGILLFGIAWQLVSGGSGSHDDVAAGNTVWGAVRVIIVADAVMSLDNVIALVGVSGGNLWLLGIGVVLTIPLVIWGSSLLSSLLDRFPILVYAGSALLAWVASEMLLADEAVSHLVPGNTIVMELAITAVFVVAVVVYTRVFRRK